MNAQPRLTSIVVPCFNQREFTRLCFQALLKHTRPPWELIAVDNGSTDDTAAYLAGVQDAARVPVTVVRNATNRGFPAAINQGLQEARGEYLVLLNNDAVVTDGWLEQLIALSRARTGTTKLQAKNGTTEGRESTEEEVKKDESEKSSREGEWRAEGESECREEDRSHGGTEVRSGSEGSDEREESCREGNSRREGESNKGAGGREAGDWQLATENSQLVIGLTGPMSNYAAPPQWVENVPYRDLEEMQAFARQWRDQHRGKWFTVPKLSGFCLLMRRDVYDTIGGLDERFGLGLFDDDDLAERARRAGFALAVAHDLFVHHFGSRTFAGNGIDAGALLDENARRFAAKWGRTESRGRRVALRPWPVPNGPPIKRKEEDRERRPKPPPIAYPSADTSLLSSADRQPRQLKIALTVIARDEESNLPHCLESVREIFDEIVVVDTGSTDRTREIAQEFGARVFDFPWIDDFAAARNEALKHATGEYAFWLDADDVVDPPQRVQLQALLDGLRPDDDAGYVVRCSCDPPPNSNVGETVVDHIRLFPLREEIRWTYRVHEQILPALRKANIPVRWTDLVVRHTGYVDPALRERKLQRDSRILLEELEQRPDDPFALFNLGATAMERKDWQGALEYLGRSLAHSSPSDSITLKLFALIARAQQMLGQTGAALRTCAEGLALDADDAELLFRKGMVHRQRGESAQAEACWHRILSLKRPERFCSVDQGIYGHLTRRNLAMLAAERGDCLEAARQWRAVLAECPGDREALAKLEWLDPERHVTPVPTGRDPTRPLHHGPP